MRLGIQVVELEIRETGFSRRDPLARDAAGQRQMEINIQHMHGVVNVEYLIAFYENIPPRVGFGI
jgi:hypothetical protein